MGRNKTGALTNSEVMRLDISRLKRSGHLTPGAEVTGYLSWTNGASLSIKTHYGKEVYLELFYIHGNEPKRVRIEIERRDSNLGRGEVLFFICPILGKRARILYMAYGSGIFKSREAYANRIYYPGQISSKIDRAINRYWAIEKKIERLDELRDQSYYKGIETKRYQRLLRLQDNQDTAYTEHLLQIGERYIEYTE